MTEKFRVVKAGELMTPHEAGATLLKTEYKGKTIGQLTLASLKLANGPGGVMSMLESEPYKMLAELGMAAIPLDDYLHFYHLHKLVAAIPELRSAALALRPYLGVAVGGQPIESTTSHSLSPPKKKAVKLTIIKG